MDTATERDATSGPLTTARKQRLRRRLVAWYGRHARGLPWRRSRDPYRVWVSEIMLQQTQVATVQDYFRRFVRELPNVQRLAAADEEQVLRLWEGLGYYRRARQLHAAARQIVARHGGRFPQDVQTLQTLPGIGRYTAGAIASIAFDRRAPILEANTTRLLCRLLAYRGDPSATAGQRVLWAAAEAILPRKNVAQFNQALMELGSLVCTPAEPRCDECPLADLCQSRELGLQHKIPRPKARQQYVNLREAAVVVRNNGRVLVRRCADGERWAGLWDFPRFELVAETRRSVRDEIVDKVRRQTGITCEPRELVKTIKHGVTRYRITLDCYQAAYVSGRVRATNGSAVRWLSPTDLADLPLSATGRKLAQLVTQRRGMNHRGTENTEDDDPQIKPLMSPNSR